MSMSTYHILLLAFAIIVSAAYATPNQVLVWRQLDPKFKELMHAALVVFKEFARNPANKDLEQAYFWMSGKVFDREDVNKDGFLDLIEFMNFFNDVFRYMATTDRPIIAIYPNTLEQMEPIVEIFFRGMDRDGDHKLSKQEYSELEKQMVSLSSLISLGNKEQ